MTKRLSEIIVCIKGAGEMASAVAWRLYQANVRQIFMLEVPQPLAVRRRVSFCEAVYTGRQTIETVTAVKTTDRADTVIAWEKGHIAVLVDPEGNSLAALQPDVFIDAILAKKNLGTHRTQAPLVIGLGPGFEADRDVHAVIETNRGHNLGRIITRGCAEPNTGIPGRIAGYAGRRVLRAPCDGRFHASLDIGQLVKTGDTVGMVKDQKVCAEIDGVLRGLIRHDTEVTAQMKLGDIDPRGIVAYCGTISDKARAISGSVLEAVFGRFLSSEK
jgi:xanthine dehydrogenase accessory factor